MYKVIKLFSIFVMSFSFIACGGGGNSSSSNEVTLSPSPSPSHTDTANTNNGSETIRNESIDSEFSNISVGYRKVKETPLKKGTLFASVNGVGETCSQNAPCNLRYAFTKVKAGDILFLRGGVYSLEQTCSLENSGEKENPIIIESYPGETAILDGGKVMPEDVASDWNDKISGITLGSAINYVYIRKLEVRHMDSLGITVRGSHNVVEGCNTHHNFYAGIGVSGGDWHKDAPYNRGYNIIQDNLVHDNSDVGLHGGSGDGGNADGIWIGAGKHNQVIYNTVYANSDDGIDTWRSNDTYVAYNISYDNGRSEGDGNGFKLGGHWDKVKDQPKLDTKTGLRAVAEHNIAYNNKADGFDFNLGMDVVIRYNTAYNNGRYGYVGCKLAHTKVSYNIAAENNLGSMFSRSDWGDFESIDNSWDKEGSVKFLNTDPRSKDFLRPEKGSGFEEIGAYYDTNVITQDKNQIKKTELENDNEYLTITIKGNFIPKSHFELFINSDYNETTGYRRDGKIKGAEYLVEDHTLFVYAGDGKNWKWTKLGKVESNISMTLWRAKVPLVSIGLGGGEFIGFVAEVLSEDWKYGLYAEPGEYLILDNQEEDKETIFHLYQKGEFENYTHFSFFIDSDNNPNTGYTRGKIKGADYLVDDNGLLYKYPKDATGWKWDRVQDGIVFTHTDEMMQMEVSSILLGNTKFITYYAMVSTSDWKRNDVFDGQSLNNTISIDNQTITYSELDGNIKNPERGLYANHYLASSSYRGYSTKAGKYKWVVDHGYRVFVEKLVLVDFRDQPISDEYLERVRKDFTFARQNGLKMIVRATYNEHQGDPDAPLDIVLNHIKQLKPIYNEYKDVIMSVEAGFIGAWGEWHSSTNGLDQNNQAKDAIKNALLKAIPSSISVQFRNPPEIMRWYPTPLNAKDAYSGRTQSRVGFYDDCFNWNASDMGTFTGNSNSIKRQKEYIKQNSKFTPTIGETCPIDVSKGSTASCEGAIKLAEEIHLTSLGDSGDWHPEWTKPINVYKNEGCWDEIVRRLGYRFVLKSATLPTVATINNSFSGEIKIENNGFASLVNRREAYIVLENENKRFEFKLNTDPRKWEPNQTTTIKFDTTLSNSLTEGKYKVALWLPDMHENLKDKQKYAIRTANTNSWDSQKGYNVLGEVEVITGDKLVTKTSKIFLIGDSTVHNIDYPDNNGKYFEQGWGDVISNYMKNPNNLFNEARSGASSSSYKIEDVDRHDWAETKNIIKKVDISNGAYLLIQFGHNDATVGKDRYTEPGVGNQFYNELKVYIDEAKELGVTPVLVTPVERLLLGKHSHTPYANTIRELAKNENILLLDLTGKSFNEFSKYGSTEEIYEKFAYDDHTHFNPVGANIVAGWVKELVCNSNDTVLCQQFK